MLSNEYKCLHTNLRIEGLDEMVDPTNDDLLLKEFLEDLHKIDRRYSEDLFDLKVSHLQKIEDLRSEYKAKTDEIIGRFEKVNDVFESDKKNGR